MWKVDQIKAENLLSFKKLHYTLQQGITTLVYGENKDSDNQGSNGSGKSSLNEAIAIAVIGSPLRKCSSTDIINDDADVCKISVGFKNQALNTEMLVSRIFERKSSSVCIVQKWVSGIEQPVKLSGVAEYNKYILDELGVNKDEFLNYILLSKYTYKNFLSASDREKKEIINNFSNGNKVDEAIAILQVDAKEVNDTVEALKLKEAELNGRVSVLQQQIEDEKTSAVERQQQTLNKIKDAKENIKGKRSELRQQSEVASEEIERLAELQRGKDELETWSDEVKHTEEIDTVIVQISTKNRELGRGSSEINKQIEDAYKKYDENELLLTEVKSEIGASTQEYNRLNEELHYIIEDAEKEDVLLGKKREKSKKEISNVLASIKEINTEKRSLQEEIESIRAKTTKLQAVIKGKIECPKCHHQFLINPEISLELAEENLKLTIDDGVACKEKLTQSESKLSEAKSKQESLQNDEMLIPVRSELHSKINEIKTRIETVKSNTNRLNIKLKSIERDLESCDANVIKIIDNELDEILYFADSQLRKQKSITDTAKRAEESIKSDLSVLEARVSQLEAITQEGNETSLKTSLKTYKGQLSDVQTELQSEVKKMDKYTEQEQLFIQYKTHLANTKIEALSKVTNSFLEDIGSELRVQFTGFKVLKSGKIRDKISVILLRNGEEVGEYGKLSVGEQGRINLACILAMNKLVNINCEANKGMDILVLDEILDGIDESGLNAILETLNNTGLTCLVVSHGKTSESYEHTITITKQHGESSIS